MGNKMSDQEPDGLDEQNQDVLIDFTPNCRYGVTCYRKNPDHFRKFRHPHLPSDPENETNKESVEIKIEIGHDATLKTAKTSQGHTHDWTAFVRCTNQAATAFFIEKVEFSFPRSVSRPPLVVNQSPFNATDSGSRSFVMNIDISFKCLPDPKKTRIDYDLYLKDNASFSNVRLVKLIIQNPPSDFRQRLLLAGGVMIQVPDSSTWDNVRQNLPSTSLTNKRKVGDSSTSQSANDECDAFGHLCTAKLRKLEALSPPQKTLAEKLISEVLFHAEQKSLTNESCVHLIGQSQVACPTISVKTEPSETASSTSSTVSIKSEVESTSSSGLPHPNIKSEVDSPSSSTVSHQTIKSEAESPSSSTVSHQTIKSEAESPSFLFDIDDCVILETIKSDKFEGVPFIIEIKDETD